MATSTLTDESVTITVPAECVDGFRRGAARGVGFWGESLAGTYDGVRAVEEQCEDRDRLQRSLTVLDQIPPETASAVTIEASVGTVREILLAAAEVWVAELGGVLGEGGYLESQHDLAEAGELGRRIAWAATECEAVA